MLRLMDFEFESTTMLRSSIIIVIIVIGQSLTISAVQLTRASSERVSEPFPTWWFQISVFWCRVSHLLLVISNLLVLRILYYRGRTVTCTRWFNLSLVHVR